MPKGREAFKRLLQRPGIIMAPAAHDAISAMIIEKAGFEAVHASGMAMGVSRLGVPDIGLMSAAEVIDQAANMTEAVTIPVIADADTGYGNVNNVYRTVKSFERAGVAGIHLEDQVMPKKCGIMGGRALVSTDEMVNKIRVALDAREDSNFVIIARTDARGVIGIDEAERRFNRYLEAGADLLLVAEPYEVTELERVARAFPDKVAFCGGNSGQPETTLPFSVYEEWKIKLIIYPHLALYSAAKAMRKICAELKQEKYLTQERIAELCGGFREFQELVGLPVWNEREKKYS